MRAGRSRHWAPGARLALAVLATGMMLATIAAACGPTRHKQVDTIRIDAPASRVWSVVGDYSDFGWTGRIAQTIASGGLVPDVARRQLTFVSGARLSDLLTAHDPEQMAIAFVTETDDVRELPARNYASRISVREEGGHAIVDWRGAFVRGFPNNDPPPELSDDVAVAAVAAFQQAALTNLKRIVEGGH